MWLEKWLILSGDIMGIDLVTIYKDSEYEIKMVKLVADWLSHKKKLTYKLHTWESENILTEVSAIFEPTKPFMSSRQIPVFSKDTGYIMMYKPYDIFGEAFMLLGDAIRNLQEKYASYSWKQDVANLIEKYYRLQGIGDCGCYMFEEPIHQVDGVLTFDTEDRFIVLPFIINDGKFKRIDE